MASSVRAQIAELTSIAEEYAADSSKNFRTISDAYQEIASCHLCYGNYKMAAHYFEQAFKFRRDYHLDKENARLCVMAGLCHYRTGGIIQSERFFGYAVTAAKQANSDYFQCISTSNMALVHLAQGRTAKAIEMATESVELARTIVATASEKDEFLEFVRVLVTVLIQSGKFKRALKIIEENEFSENESCVLRAGIAFVSGDRKASLDHLLRAHGMRDEGNTPPIEGEVENRSDIDETSGASLTHTEADEEKNGKSCLSVTNLDNGKATEYRNRKDMVECLIDYNLHVAYARLGEYALEKTHLDTAVDVMFRILLNDQKESAELVHRQATDGVTEKTVFPPLDTTMAPFVLAHHCNVAKISTNITTLPMLSSMSIQAGALPCENDESGVIETAHADLGALLLSWKTNPQINTMMELHEHQQTNPFELPKIAERKNDIAVSDNSSGENPVIDVLLGEDNQQLQDTENVDVQLAQLSMSDATMLIDLVKKRTDGGTSLDTIPRTTSFVVTPASSPRNLAPPDKIGDKKKKGKKDKNLPSKDKIAESKKDKQGDSKGAKPAKKKVKSTVKGKTKIPTHGSLKIEMMPQCDPSRVEGINARDRVIQEAMILCHGSGFSFMNIAGVGNASLADDADAEYATYCDQITEAKRQLLEIEESITTSAGETSVRTLSSGDCRDDGTMLSLYSTLSMICTLLNHRKEAGIYLQKYTEVAEASNLPEYQAIGYRLQLDYEEWNSAPMLSQMVSSQKLSRLQGILQLAKKYFCCAERARAVNLELFYDAWKRLVNVYTEISALPDTPGAPKPPDTETLEENIALLTADEIEFNENNDLAWLKTYSRIRAKMVGGKMSMSLAASVESSAKHLVDLGA